ncbi:MAG: hypothetical protein ACRD3D_05205 [Terriglobia bacterium]
MSATLVITAKLALGDSAGAGIQARWTGTFAGRRRRAAGFAPVARPVTRRGRSS